MARNDTEHLESACLPIMCDFATVLSTEHGAWRLQKFVDITAISNPFSGDFFHCSIGMSPP